MTSFRALVVCLVALVPTLLFAADDPWDGVPFSADPKTVLEAASRIPPVEDEGVIVLLDETRYELDADGRMQRREYLVYRVVDQASAEAWSDIEVAWSPWYSERPVVDARVIAKDGTVHRLDPKSFGAADADDEPSMFTDTRILHGPLPAVAEGSVVEQTIVWHDKSPIEGAGVTHRHQFGRWVTSRRSRMVLEHPAALAVKIANRTRPAIEPAKTERDGRVTLVYETGVLPPFEVWETSVPSDIMPRSIVAFSTGTSWADLARRYSDIVDTRIGNDPLPKLPGLKTGAPARDIAALILAKIERGIRYAGVEFGEGSIIPRTPKETLEHKYGDCKDKAILLVAMLRRAGVPAHVALLVAGQGPDVDPDLPGLGHFNHVIVAAGEGENRFWVDPTDEFARAGELPVQDQNRFALIASADTAALIRTPAATAADNVTVETREFFLAEQGPARVVETSVYSGQSERERRVDYAGSNDELIKKGLEEYAIDQFAAKSLGKYETSDPHDMNAPFRIQLEALTASRGLTQNGEAEIGVYLNRLTAALPWDLRPYDNEATEKERKPRAHDYVLTLPHTHDLRYRIHPPAGYSLHEQPAKTTENIGPFVVTRELTVENDGTVMATYRMTADARRLTPAQFEETRTALGKFEKQDVILIRFDQLGQKHLDAGEIGKAIEEFRGWTVKHPKEASHHADMARALLTAGLGDEARRTARRAIEVEPKSAYAHVTLARTLIHDPIGRELKKGCDVPQAIVAYRKAKELDPSNIAPRAELAVLLEHNDAGKKHGKGARLAEAIAEWESLKTETDANKDYIDRQLVTLYVRTKEWAKLKELTGTTTAADIKEAHRVLAIAMLEGGPAALDAARSLDQAQRRTVMQQAGSMIALQRQYAVAAELLEAAAQGAPNAAAMREQIAVLRKTTRLEETQRDPNDPKELLIRLFFALDSGDMRSRLQPLMVTEAFEVFDDEKEKTQSEEETTKDDTDLFLFDVIASAIEVQKDGDEKIGYRLRGRAPGQAPDLKVFITQEGGVWKIAAIGYAPEMIGLRALRLAQAGDAAGARQWLDWAREEVEGGSGEDPVQSSAFANLWTRGRAAEMDRILIAAAALLPETKKSAELVLPVLTAARPNTSEEVQWRIDQVLTECYELTGDKEARLAAADRLAARFPDSESAFSMGIEALQDLGRLDEARNRATQRLQHLANDPTALRILARMATAAGQYGEGQRYRSQILANAAEPLAEDYNEQAWSALFAGTSLDDAVEQARRAVAIEPLHYASLNTLAILYAERNAPTEAREMLLRSVASQTELEDADWYVVARIAESYGLRDSAIEVYRKLARPEKPEATCWQLAQKRLAELAPAKGGKKRR